ncbi:MAG: post-COAP-1 domain-containing protein, partial [Candidatus Promineifilaceae bacterium]
AQYSLDGGATWAAMSAADGAFDEVSEAVTAGAVAPAAAGIYDLCVRASDAAGNTGAASCALFVVFNPDGGFATGGGWIDVGGEHANVGFVAKYKNDGSLEGSTQFHHQAGDLNFQSTSYDWLVIAAGGASAELRGQGTVNGQMAPDGSSYQFTLSAGDGNPDTFRLRVWWLNNGVETVVFDNGASQPLGGGSIKIHQAN